MHRWGGGGGGGGGWWGRGEALRLEKEPGERKVTLLTQL